MRIEPTALPGLMRLIPEPISDERGFFARIFCVDEFAAAGIAFSPQQINLSRNRARGTLRGLHFQAAPFAEAKVVRVTHGAIFDVAVDLRPESPHYRQWAGFRLEAQTGEALFIPEGFAHGFLTLEAESDVHYLMGRAYIPGQARGLRWDDPALGIAWPETPTCLNEADRNWPLLTSAPVTSDQAPPAKLASARPEPL